MHTDNPTLERKVRIDGAQSRRVGNFRALEAPVVEILWTRGRLRGKVDMRRQRTKWLAAAVASRIACVAVDIASYRCLEFVRVIRVLLHATRQNLIHTVLAKNV